MEIQEQNNIIRIANEWVEVCFDLTVGHYHITDLRDGTLCLSKAYADMDGRWTIGGISPYRGGKALGEKLSHTWHLETVEDAFGTGQTLVISSAQEGFPGIVTTFTLYENQGFLVLGGGVHNPLSYDIRMLVFRPLAGADLFPALGVTDAQTLNGGAGAEPTLVEQGCKRFSPNSLLLTFTTNRQRRSLVMGGLVYQDFGKYVSIGDADPASAEPFARAYARREAHSRPTYLWSEDPVGRLVAPGETYVPSDTFYIDFTTNDPFEALERYGRRVRLVNHASPNVYNFPTVCGWMVSNKRLGNGRDINNAPGLVEEMEDAGRTGFLKVSPVAVRLESDTYTYADAGDTEQGWWDDEHFIKYGSLRAPYDTFKGWCEAVKRRGGIPFTYIQVGLPSDDYAKAFPGHMLGNDLSKLHIRHRHHEPRVTYDYTDPGFQEQVRRVWARFREAGLQGVKFDYPETGWRPEGGFDDRRTTTAAAYRKIYELCREGLGPDAYIHERMLGESGRPRLDLTVGVVDLQRTCDDASHFEPEMVRDCGLRWYKNRVMFSYYPDGKALFKPGTKEPLSPVERRAMLTMLFVVSGRIELGTSFRDMTPEMVHDLTRIFPQYAEPRSARPVDAFVAGRTCPQVYVLEVTHDWYQVALYNTAKQPGLVTAPLSGDAVTTGAIGVDEGSNYYVYDFWGNALVGQVAGSEQLALQMDAGEARMLSLRKVLDRPQVISTNRHIFQGYLDLEHVQWRADRSELVGEARCLGQETYSITIATNGYTPAGVDAQNASVRRRVLSDDPMLVMLDIDCSENRRVPWRVSFEK